jgi:fatty acid desaturase
MLKRAVDARQLLIVAVYYGLLIGMYCLPPCRNVFCLAVACAFSFLCAVVNHNNLHQGMFRSRNANLFFRYLLSFAALYPVSANVPAHNLVHHHFGDDGQPDWADPGSVRFRWNLLNLLHFPNVAGPITFAGVSRWYRGFGRAGARRRYTGEAVFAFGLTAALLVHDFWTGLFFIVVPQLFGARWFLRINLIQHDGCTLDSRFNHSRNFVGVGFNWWMMNNGFHTVHHNRAGLHWSELPAAHRAEVAPHILGELEQPSLLAYLLRTYAFSWARRADVTDAQRRSVVDAV